MFIVVLSELERFDSCSFEWVCMEWISSETLSELWAATVTGKYELTTAKMSCREKKKFD